MRFAKSKLFNAARFKHAVANAQSSPISIYKGTLKTAVSELKKHQNEGVSASLLIENYTWLVDQLINQAWQHHAHLLPEGLAVELVAVGGYGRAELHPFSDVDVLILLGSNDYESAQTFIESFLQFLWDIGFDVGHSVRSIKDCIKEARQDISIMSNLLESRHLAGDTQLILTLDDKLRNGRVWSADKFFNGKLQEQKERYKQYFNTAYSLEPNIKESPGGLRDLQTILWVYNRAYGVRTFKQMNEQGFIDNDEYRLLIRSRNILWKLRTGLHLLTNRREDRLLFDSQRELATEFGYQDTGTHLAVEQLMKRYYRTVKSVTYLNEILLSHYRTSHSRLRLISTSKNLDDDFQVKNKVIEARHDNLFSKKPCAMLKLFVLMQEYEITEVHPDTIRAIRTNLARVNNEFRADPRCKSLFLQLFLSPGIGLTNALSRMNNYGLLGAYIPAFGAIVGQMQHDLFHVYTVDGHTLMVIRNLTRLRKYPDEYPLASRLLNNLHKPERLFIGALFHDIAKGRGGDHSELGAVDAKQFCLEHNMSEYDAKLVAWLVSNHLIMSHFSQRRDITDPMVILEFANIVGDIEHLDNLYLLTFADIRGTSPKVWNAWKGQLLMDLYHATRQALGRGIAKPINEQEHVDEDKKEAIDLLIEQGIDTSNAEQFWQTISNDYFIRNEPYYIAWHASSLTENSAISIPIVSVRYSERLEANMFFVFAPESNSLFTKVTASFDELDLSIIEARLHSTNTGFALHTFNAIVPDNELAQKGKYMRFLQERLRDLIINSKPTERISRRKSSRALKHFPIKPRVDFNFDNPNYTVMEVMALDQPGLLHNVASVLQQFNIKLVSAKIATLGERAEDVFFIEQQNNTPVTDKKTLAEIDKQICQALDQTSNEKT